jgi:hypothetical protein
MKLFNKIFNKTKLTPLEESIKLIDYSDDKEIKKPGNQKEEVLSHLLEFGSITSMQAIELYGITRLAAKIHELREDNYNITTKNQSFTNRYKNLSTYGIYTLIKK